MELYKKNKEMYVRVLSELIKNTQGSPSVNEIRYFTDGINEVLEVEYYSGRKAYINVNSNSSYAILKCVVNLLEKGKCQGLLNIYDESANRFIRNTIDGAIQ